MSDANVFGPSIDGSDVETALLAHLRYWMPTYVAFQRRHKDPEKKRWKYGISPIKSYTISHAAQAAEKWPEDQLPMLVAQSPGMEGDPFVDGEGVTAAVYGIVLSAITSGKTMDDAKALARLYASAARGAIMQNPALDAGTGVAFSGGVSMKAERNAPILRGVEAERNLMVVSTPYLIEVPNIFDADAGPVTRREDPDVEPEDFPTVKEGGSTATVEALTASGFFDDTE